MSPDSVQDKQEQAEQLAARSELGDAQRAELLTAKNLSLGKALGEAKAELVALRKDLAEALDMTHLMLAGHFPSIPYFGEARGDLFLRGRDLLKKHGMIEGTGE